VLLYALLGLVFTGFGFLLRRGSNKDFSVVAETFGLLAFAIFSYPLTWAGFLSWGYRHAELNQWILPALGALAALLVALGCRNLTTLLPQWRVTWGATLAGAAALLVAAHFVPQQTDWHWFGHMTPLNTVAAIAIFIFCLLQVQVGVQERSRFLVNLGVTFIALDIIATYIGLFSSMAFTGMMFILSGVFLIVFAVFLEKKRRALMQQIKTNQETQP
jgi:peptidoglycan/LPS O-acetylase OafA/YrhL